MMDAFAVGGSGEGDRVAVVLGVKDVDLLALRESSYLGAREPEADELLLLVMVVPWLGQPSGSKHGHVDMVGTGTDGSTRVGSTLRVIILVDVIVFFVDSLASDDGDAVSVDERLLAVGVMVLTVFRIGVSVAVVVRTRVGVVEPEGLFEPTVPALSRADVMDGDGDGDALSPSRFMGVDEPLPVRVLDADGDRTFTMLLTAGCEMSGTFVELTGLDDRRVVGDDDIDGGTVWGAALNDLIAVATI